MMPPVVGKGAVLQSFPTLQDWKKMSYVSMMTLSGGSVAEGWRRMDPVLLRIDALVDAYNQAKNGDGKAGELQYLLGELFLATVYWANHYMKDSQHMDARRKAAVMSLSFTVTKELANALQCPPGEVGTRLYNMFGKALEHDKALTDAKDPSHYLDAAKRQQWRIIFRGGKAYRFTDRKATLESLVPLDTREYAGVMTAVGDEERGGDCGYALSMSNDLYVAPLLGRDIGKYHKPGERAQVVNYQAKKKGVGVEIKTNLDEAPVYHSSFLGGWPVQCAGMITAKDGIITAVTNESGHYQPKDTALVKLLQLLKQVGMDPSNIDIQGSRVAGGPYKGAEFLQKSGDWEAMRKSARKFLWDRYNTLAKANAESALRTLVQERFDGLKLSLGKSLSRYDLWKYAYQDVCRDLAVFDPGTWEARAKGAPIPPPVPKKRV